jgi:Flp pilus assembly protein TadG
MRKMPGPSLRKMASRFATDRRGVAAVEFSLILPFLLLLMLGMAETVTALNHDRKVGQVANTVADLVAQAESVSTGDVSDIMLAASEIMQPYPDTNMEVIVASVTFNDDGDPEVDWSRNNAGGTPWAGGSTPPIEFPDTLAVAGTSLVVSQTTYDYAPMFSSLVENMYSGASSISLSDTYYYKPRITTTVTLD